MSFGEQIKNIRKKEKLTQEQFAIRLNVSRQVVSNWENNKNLPDIGIDRTDAFQHQFPQYIFPDIVGRTGASAAFVAGAYIMVLLAVKALAGSKVQLVPAIGTEQKPGE